MSNYTKPKVTIDLEEYNELLKTAEEKVTIRPSDEQIEAVLNFLLCSKERGFSEADLKRLQFKYQCRVDVRYIQDGSQVTTFKLKITPLN